MPKKRGFKVTPKMKKWFMKEIDYLKEIFYLQGWEIVITFHGENDEDRGRVAAEVRTTWEYRRAELKIYQAFWEECPEAARDVLVHEVVHIVTSQPFALIDGAQKGRIITNDEVHQVMEHMTTWLESIISNGLPKGKA